MIFIDWISTPSHRNFNRSLFSSLNLNDSLCYVFCEELINEYVDCLNLKYGKNRIFHALKVLSLCWAHKDEKIVFVTYDQMFLPFVMLITRSFSVIEHNTTPEINGFYKNVLWQRFLFRKIHP